MCGVLALHININIGLEAAELFVLSRAFGQTSANLLLNGSGLESDYSI